MSDVTEKGVIPPTLKKLLITLGSIFKYAVVKRICEYNPVREIDKPKSTNKKKVDFMNPTEIRTLIDNAEGEKFKTLLTLSVISGLRQGEALGLKWTDIDWFNCQVHVRRTYNHGSFYEPKSQTSNRAVDLGPTAMTRLKKWKVMCPPNELDLVFPNPDKPEKCLKLMFVFHSMFDVGVFAYLDVHLFLTTTFSSIIENFLCFLHRTQLVTV